MSPGQPSRQHFEHTQWSMAMRADAALAPDARGALIALCLRFWYPVYAYLRQCGHGPELAQDIARNFLQHVFEHFRDVGTGQAHGRFRRYLLERLRIFLANDRCDSRAENPVAELDQPPRDLEARNQRDNADAQSAEQAFQLSFALDLLARAFVRLREEAGETGRLEMYEALEPFLVEEPSSAESDELARCLRTRSVVIVIALKRLRQRFRELIDGELADTVSSAAELLAEQQALYAVLRDYG